MEWGDGHRWLDQRVELSQISTFESWADASQRTRTVTTMDTPPRV